jgi:hypothetical protein
MPNSKWINRALALAGAGLFVAGCGGSERIEGGLFERISMIGAAPAPT